MVFAIILLVLLAFSLLYNLGNFASGMVHPAGRFARTSGPRLDEVIAEDNSAANKVAVIELDGIITDQAFDQGGNSMVEIIKAQLKHAEEDEHVKAVVLKVDSPGGEVLAADEIYRAIEDFQSKNPRKPVVASMGSLAASGGYYVSAPCRWIVANKLTITGSIGVIMHSWNYRGLMNKVGLRPEVYKSGKFKDMLSGEKEPDEITAEEKAMVQALIDETYGQFKQVVIDGRSKAFDRNKSTSEKGRKLVSDWANYADGRVLSGSEAFKLGFVDELGNFEDAVDRAKRMAGIRDANLIRYQLRYDISDLFRLFGKTEAPGIRIDLGMEPPKLQAGRLYFLSPSFAH
jgi:protease IV